MAECSSATIAGWRSSLHLFHRFLAYQSGLKTPPLRAGKSSASVWGWETTLGTAGPAGIDAGGAVATTTPPTNVSDGQGGGPPSGSPCSAQQSPACKAWGAV